MGKAKRPHRVKLIIGMLAKNKKLFESIEEFFVKMFGEIDYRSPLILFKHTDYYAEEMGRPLKRRFVSFKRHILPEDISKIKAAANALEKRLSVKKLSYLARQVNIDPGYISDSKLVLATTKDYYHRIYLRRGIYAEVTLAWKKDGFCPFEWTYPDYKTAEYAAILNKIRELYMNERATHAG